MNFNIWSRVSFSFKDDILYYREFNTIFLSTIELARFQVENITETGNSSDSRANA